MNDWRSLLLLFFHYIVYAYVLVGWITRKCVWLWFYVAVLSLIGLLWIVNDNVCILTTLTNKFNGNDAGVPFESPACIFKINPKCTEVVLVALIIVNLARLIRAYVCGKSGGEHC
jgi:hypothetical protein